VETLNRTRTRQDRAEVAPLSVQREIAIARRMVDEAVSRYEVAAEAWEDMDGDRRISAQMDGVKPPDSREVLAALDVCGRLQTRLSQIEARESVPIQSVLEFMSQIRGLVAQFVPDEDRQRALIGAIQRLDLRS